MNLNWEEFLQILPITEIEEEKEHSKNLDKKLIVMKIYSPKSIILYSVLSLKLEKWGWKNQCSKKFITQQLTYILYF